jgi:hypothetical protein
VGIGIPPVIAERSHDPEGDSLDAPITSSRIAGFVRGATREGILVSGRTISFGGLWIMALRWAGDGMIR